tara:strand:+ start:2535 stop:3548 length:1014 start_codon:yes stop_codon:yes gene_type:complete
MKSKYILVTGGLGYIGSHTTIALIDKGYKVCIIDNLSNSSIDVLKRIKKITNISPDFFEFDLTDAYKAKTFFKKNNKFDGVIHFAAKKSVDESVIKPLDYYYNNIQSLINLLENINTDVKFIFSSSCTVYGQAEKLPITETAPLKKPESPYGNTKKICENILEDKTKIETKLSTVILRYFNPIGAHPSGLIGEDPRNVPQNLVPIITQFAIGKLKKFAVFGDDYPTRDGTCIRDYISIMDLADAHISALEYLFSNKKNNIYNVFNVGTGEGKSVKEVIDSFNKVSGKNLQYDVRPRRKGDVISAFADISKAKKILNWASKVSFEDAVLSAWNWEQNK